MTRAAVYARYSSEGQKESSIEDQVRNCQRWAERESLENIQQYSDSAITGSTAERPGFKAMLMDAEVAALKPAVKRGGTTFVSSARR